MRGIKRKIKNLLFCNRFVLGKKPKPFYPKIENVEELVKQFGSPLFVASEEKLIEKYQYVEKIIKKAYPNSQIAYSFKTNYLPGICQIFKNLGAMAEVVSSFEYNLAKKLGYKGGEIIFNGPYKKDEELKLAIQDGALVNIDNFDELKRMKKIVKKSASIDKILFILVKRNML